MREDEGGDEVVGDPAGGLGEDVRGGGHDEEKVRVEVEFNVRHRALGRVLPFARRDRVSREGLEGDRPHEAGRVFRHRHAHVGAELDEAAHDFAGLVGGDAARDGNGDLAVFEHTPLLAAKVPLL